MAGIKKFMGGSVVYTYRVDVEKWQRFTAIAESKGLPVSRLLDTIVDDFLAQQSEAKDENGEGEQQMP